MSKKIIAIIMACVMCFSVLFTGCAEENENANVDNIDKIENVDNVDDEQASTGLGDVIGSGIGDKIDDVVSNVLSRQQPSSQSVVELAEKNELEINNVKNYADFLLYVNQNDPDLRVLRDTLAPDRGKELPFDVLFNVGNGRLKVVNTNYFGDVNGALVYFEECTYFFDQIWFTNGLKLDTYYVKPDMIGSAYDFFLATYCKINTVPEGEPEIYRLVEYDESLFENNSLLSIKDSEIQSKMTFVKVCDDLLLKYNKDGDLIEIYFFVDDVCVDVTFHGDGQRITFAQAISKTRCAFLTALLNKDTVSTAMDVIENIMDSVKEQN